MWISLWDYARKIDQWYDIYKNFSWLLNQEEVEYNEDDNKVHAEMFVWDEISLVCIINSFTSPAFVILFKLVQGIVIFYYILGTPCCFYLLPRR